MLTSNVTGRFPTPKTLFTFHPSSMNDPQLYQALQTAKFFCSRVGSPLVATTVARSAHSDLGRQFEGRLGEVLETHVILNNAASPPTDVERLWSDPVYAVAKAVVIVTHLPKSPMAKIFGHFGRNLLQVAKIPILAIRADAAVLTSIKRVLFLTDLSDDERFLFRQAREWARELKAELIITKSLLGPWPFAVQSADGFAGVVSEVSQKTIDDAHVAEKTGTRWCAEAIAAGVSAQFELVTGQPNVALGSIEAARDLGADLIIVSRKHRTNFATQIVADAFGATIEDLLATSTLPILILHQ